MTNIQPIIMAGGQGTRLWPLSRKSFPKQFANVLGTNTFPQKTVLSNKFGRGEFSPTNYIYAFGFKIYSC